MPDQDAIEIDYPSVRVVSVPNQPELDSTVLWPASLSLDSPHIPASHTCSGPTWKLGIEILSWGHLR